MRILTLLRLSQRRFPLPRGLAGRGNENERATGKWPELAGWKTCHYVVARFPACQFSGLSCPELASPLIFDPNPNFSPQSHRDYREDKVGNECEPSLVPAGRLIIAQCFNIGYSSRKISESRRDDRVTTFEHQPSLRDLFYSCKTPNVKTLGYYQMFLPEQSITVGRSGSILFH